MCVIAYKAKNVRFPSKERIKDMWDNNPDGAGIMWRDNDTNKIKFVKGFMHLSQFNKWVDKNLKWLEDVECALHFRITTHGGTSKGNCHPFVCDCNVDSHLLSGEADYVLMHNGVLPIKPRKQDISDSAELALRVGGYENPMDCLDVFDELLHGNRVICMGKDGTMMYGDSFVDCCKDGIMYSNDHFLDDWSSFGLRRKWWEDDYPSMRPATPKKEVKEGAMVKIGDIVDKAVAKLTNKQEEIKDKCLATGTGWWWDDKRKMWFDMFGRETHIEDIDPDFLSTDDYDEYISQLEENRFNSGDLQEEADYYGMDLDEYIEYINGGI